MNTKAMFFILSILGISFAACEKIDDRIVPSATVTTRDYPLSAFDDLDVSDVFTVYVTFSETVQELRIEANDNLHSVIDIDQEGGRLSIGLDKHVQLKGAEPVLKAYVTTNDLQRIAAAGAAKVILENDWNGSAVEIELTGASKLQGALQVGQLQAELTGASNLAIQGTADTFDLIAEGASHLTGFEFATNAFVADLEGACEASLTIHGELEVKATGASTVYYQGNGVVTYQDLTGGSKIIKVN